MLQSINIGTFANDGNGDTLRDSFIKVNENFEEMGNVINVVSSNNLVISLRNDEVSLETNNTLSFALVSNTSLVISVRDNYGNTRNVTLTLA